MSFSKDPQKLIKFLSVTGHLEAPFGSPQDIPTDISTLTLNDECVKNAIRSHQNLDANYSMFAAAVHGRELVPDGDAGPVTALMMDLPRCGSKDYDANNPHAEMAVGSGNWKRCHGIGEYHAVSVKVTNSPPTFLAPHFEQVKKNVTEAYAEVGLMVYWDGRSPINTELSFVPRSDGWIGLAIVCNNCSCTSSPIWLRLLSTYRGGSTDQDIITQWTSLIKHELGHNTGMSHSRGGVMNPSIINGLPISWKNDPSWPLLVSRFGGVPVPISPEAYEVVVARKYSGGRYVDIFPIPKQLLSGGPFPMN